MCVGAARAPRGLYETARPMSRPARNVFNTHLIVPTPPPFQRLRIPDMATPSPIPMTLAKLSPPPTNNHFARKAGFVNCTFGPRRITFSELAPPAYPPSESVYGSSSVYGYGQPAAPPPPPLPLPLGVRMSDIHALGPMVRRRCVDAGEERPLAPFVDQQVHEIIVAIWAPDRGLAWKHHYRSIPINRAYKTDRKDGLALAVVVEFTQLCPDFLKYRLVALNRISGNAYWAELGYA